MVAELTRWVTGIGHIVISHIHQNIPIKLNKTYERIGMEIVKDGEAKKMLYQGRILGFLMSFVFFGAILYGVYRMRNRQIRPIAGLTAMEEAVGRAVEVGKPVHECPGGGGLSGEYAQQSTAAIAILGHVARLCASRGARLMVSCHVVQLLPPVTEMVRQSYMREDAQAQYSDDIVTYAVGQQALMAYTMGMFEREKIAANIMVGPYFWEAIVLAEAGGAVGAMQVGGTARQSQLPAFVAACDYLLIGDELYAAAAMISEDKGQIGSIGGQDVVRAVISALLIAGLIAALMGSKLIFSLIGI